MGISSSGTKPFTALVFPMYIELGSREMSKKGICGERCDVHHLLRGGTAIFSISCNAYTRHVGMIMIHAK